MAGGRTAGVGAQQPGSGYSPQSYGASSAPELWPDTQRTERAPARPPPGLSAGKGRAWSKVPRVRKHSS